MDKIGLLNQHYHCRNPKTITRKEHYKKSHAHGPAVCFEGVIRLVLQNLWALVRKGATVQKDFIRKIVKK